MVEPPLYRWDEVSNDIDRNHARELARQRAYVEHRGATSGGGGSISVFVVLILPWLLVAVAVIVLASWLGTSTDVLRDALLDSPLGDSVATRPDGSGGEPAVVGGVLVAAALAVVMALTAVRGWYWRRWFARGGRALTLRTVLWVATLLRSVALIGGVAVAGVAAGIARGRDLDPAFRPAAFTGWWPATLVVLSCLWLSFGSVRRVEAKVRARIGAAVAASAASSPEGP